MKSRRFSGAPGSIDISGSSSRPAIRRRANRRRIPIAAPPNFIGIDPAECIAIEDSRWGIESAKGRRSRVCGDYDDLLARTPDGGRSHRRRHSTSSRRISSRRSIANGVRISAVPFSLHLNARTAEVSAELQKAMNAPGDDLAPAALAIARVEYPSLDPKPYLALLNRMGEEAAIRIQQAGNDSDSRIQRIPVRRAALRRQPRALRRPAQQLHQRGARAANRHPHQPGRHLPRSRRIAPACTSMA